jgi:hypothetical protein
MQFAKCESIKEKQNSRVNIGEKYTIYAHFSIHFSVKLYKLISDILIILMSIYNTGRV